MKKRKEKKNGLRCGTDKKTEIFGTLIWKSQPLKQSRARGALFTPSIPNPVRLFIICETAPFYSAILVFVGFPVSAIPGGTETGRGRARSG